MHVHKNAERQTEEKNSEFSSVHTQKYQSHITEEENQKNQMHITQNMDFYLIRAKYSFTHWKSTNGVLW